MLLLSVVVGVCINNLKLACRSLPAVVGVCINNSKLACRSLPAVVGVFTNNSKQGHAAKNNRNFFFMFQRNIWWVANIERVSLHAVGMRCADLIISTTRSSGTVIKNATSIYPQCPPLGCRLPEICAAVVGVCINNSKLVCCSFP